MCCGRPPKSRVPKYFAQLRCGLLQNTTVWTREHGCWTKCTSQVLRHNKGARPQWCCCAAVVVQ
eukprot:scaffold314896_cov30-Tisochrysis_lutea.AAC.3